MVEPIEPYVWDTSQIAEMLKLGIEIGAYSVLAAGLTAFVLSKILKLMLGRI